MPKELAIGSNGTKLLHSRFLVTISRAHGNSCYDPHTTQWGERLSSPTCPHFPEYLVRRTRATTSHDLLKVWNFHWILDNRTRPTFRRQRVTCGRLKNVALQPYKLSAKIITVCGLLRRLHRTTVPDTAALQSFRACSRLYHVTREQASTP